MTLTKGYVEFFFSNAKFRRLWAASVISLLGEWFNTIALFFLILEYSGSEFLLGILFSVRMGRVWAERHGRPEGRGHRHRVRQ